MSYGRKVVPQQGVGETDLKLSDWCAGGECTKGRGEGRKLEKSRVLYSKGVVNDKRKNGCSCVRGVPNLEIR